MKTLTLDKAENLIRGLKNSLQDFRSTEFEENFTRTSTLVTTSEVKNTKDCGIVRRSERWNYNSQIRKLRININDAIDVSQRNSIGGS